VDLHDSVVFTSTESEDGNEVSFLSFASCIERDLLLEAPVITFKLVIDNLDLYIRPRSETSEWHAESKHFVNVYAVKDRVLCSSVADTKLRSIDIATVNVEDVFTKRR